MLDSDIAALYRVETKSLVRAMKRNADRFQPDFMFQLTAEESADLRSQTCTSYLKSQTGTSSRGGRSWTARRKCRV